MSKVIGKKIMINYGNWYDYLEGQEGPNNFKAQYKAFSVQWNSNLFF